MIWNSLAVVPKPWRWDGIKSSYDPLVLKVKLIFRVSKVGSWSPTGYVCKLDSRMTKLVFKMVLKFLRQLHGFDVLFNEIPYKSFMTQNCKGKRKS